MRFLRAISRFIIGVVFILSGFLKAIDPIGVSLKMDEYLRAFYLGFLDFATVPLGVLLAGAEFIIGVSILKGIKMKFFSTAALWFISFFTLLTFYSALFDPVKDCGCFGEAIHLSNWETFFKNIVLLGCAVIVYLQRHKFTPIALPFWENIYLGCYSFFILAISGYSLVYLPQIDFGSFQAGTDLITSVNTRAEMEYETTFIYSKDGEQKEFTLNNVPDSSWAFVEARTKLVNASAADVEAIDFVLKKADGEYVTTQVIDVDEPLFFISIYNAEGIGRRRLKKINRMRDSLIENGARCYILSGNGADETEKAMGIVQGANNTTDSDLVNRTTSITVEDILYTDYKTALAFNRSNAGLVYISEGVIVDKWSKCDYPFKNIRRILAQDPEIVTANAVIKEQIFAEISIAFILLIILIIRFISKRLYWRYLRQLEKRKEKEKKEKAEKESEENGEKEENDVKEETVEKDVKGEKGEKKETEEKDVKEEEEKQKASSNMG